MERGARTIPLGKDLGPRHRLHLRLAERPGATTILVLMPAAQSQIGRGQINPLFSRWNWIGDYPDSHVIAVSDPALYHHESLSAAWFISPDMDILGEVAKAIERIRDELEISPHRVLVYGSSLGGFGALGVSALLDGARAVAEIPQIDLQRWPVDTALAALELHVTGATLDAYRELHPEQLDVVERFRHAGRVPEFLLITNAGDLTFADHVDFVRGIHQLQEFTGAVGTSALLIEERVNGHHVLSREQAAELLRSELARL